MERRENFSPGGIFCKDRGNCVRNVKILILSFSFYMIGYFLFEGLNLNPNHNYKNPKYPKKFRERTVS